MTQAENKRMKHKQDASDIQFIILTGLHIKADMQRAYITGGFGINTDVSLCLYLCHQ